MGWQTAPVVDAKAGFGGDKTKAWRSAPIAADDPTKDMSTFELLAAGAGKRAEDVGTLGLRTPEPADEALMRRGAAQVGAGITDLSTMVGGGRMLAGFSQLAAKYPLLARALRYTGEGLSKPQSIPQAASVGGVYGAATTPGDASDRAAGALFSGGGNSVIPLLSGVARVGKAALVDPFTDAGQRRLAEETIRRFATDPAAATSAIDSFVPSVAGVAPTTAEVTLDPGLAILQRAAQNAEPKTAGALATRQGANKAAIKTAVGNIAGSDAEKQAAIDAREAAVQANYAKAKQAVVDGDATLDDLLARPIIQDGMRAATNNAANRGAPFQLTRSIFNPVTGTIDKNPAYLGSGLHDLKMGIDSALIADPTTGAARSASAAEKDAKSAFLNWLESKIPEYGIARSEFEALSKPIDQQKIGQHLYDKLIPALEDFGIAMPGSRPSMFANAVRGDADTVKSVTGFRKPMGAVMTPDQMATINGVGDQMARTAAAAQLGMAPGSPTAQNIASNNILRQILGPLGLPESFGENALLQTLMKVPNMLYRGVSEPAVQSKLAEMVLNPTDARAALNPPATNAFMKLLSQDVPYLSPVTAVGVSNGRSVR